MDVIVARQGALDVHKAQVTACVRVPGADGQRVGQVKQFKTTVPGLLVLADWLRAHGVTHVVMEATGDYWKPIWHLLEAEFELMLVNARDVKQVPGRKTDVKDSEWLCQLAEAGLLRASFVPPKPIRDLRLLTRYRRTQISERTREAQRLHKALEDTGIKLACVATDILGKSGRDMLNALVAGTTDPDVLADLARGKLRPKIPALKEALQGRFEPLHAMLIGAILAHLDFLDEQIEQLSKAIEEQMRPFARQAELLGTIPGVAQRTAEIIIAEIGTDINRSHMWTELARDTYNNFREGRDWGFKSFRKVSGYVAEPLGGLWLNGPYLHNGSVPTLRDLLEPAAQRPAAFVRGLDIVDARNGGFLAPPCDPRAPPPEGFCFDTRLVGNGNDGHVYGTALPASDKSDLLAYLLTL